MIFSFGKKISQLQDDQILDQFRSNPDSELVAELFLRYKEMVYGVCLKYLKSPDQAKDASMEIFEELNRKLESQDIKNFKSWFYVLVKNHCLMQLRSSQKHIETEITEKDEPIVVEFPMEMHPIQEKEIKFQNLESAIDKLNKDQAKCIRLFYMEDKSYKDIEEITKLDLKKVKSYIQNGKRNLRILMEHE